jgi:hypothetical protein
LIGWQVPGIFGTANGELVSSPSTLVLRGVSGSSRGVSGDEGVLSSAIGSGVTGHAEWTRDQHSFSGATRVVACREGGMEEGVMACFCGKWVPDLRCHERATSRLE